MDVYEIVPDEPVDVNDQCCDIRRNPSTDRYLQLLASGKDSGGVRRTAILIDLYTACTHTQLTSHLVVGENADPGSPQATTSTPSQAPPERLAQGSFRLGDYLTPNPCPNFNIVESLHALVHAEAENYSGGLTKTKVLELVWP